MAMTEAKKRNEGTMTLRVDRIYSRRFKISPRIITALQASWCAIT